MNEKNNAVILLLGRRYKNCFKYPLIVSSLCSQNSLHGFWIWSHQQSTIYDGNSWLACNQFSLGKIHVQKHLNSSWKEIPKILIPETRIDWIFPVTKLKVTHGLLRSAGPCRALGNFSVASKSIQRPLILPDANIQLPRADGKILVLWYISAKARFIWRSQRGFGE